MTSDGNEGEASGSYQASVLQGPLDSHLATNTKIRATTNPPPPHPMIAMKQCHRRTMLCNTLPDRVSASPSVDNCHKTGFKGTLKRIDPDLSD